MLRLFFDVAWNGTTQPDAEGTAFCEPETASVSAWHVLTDVLRARDDFTNCRSLTLSVRNEAGVILSKLNVVAD